MARETQKDVKRRRTIHLSDSDWREISREAFRRDESAATLIRQFIKMGLREFRKAGAK